MDWLLAKTGPKWNDIENILYVIVPDRTQIISCSNKSKIIINERLRNRHGIAGFRSACAIIYYMLLFSQKDYLNRKTLQWINYNAPNYNLLGS